MISCLARRCIIGVYIGARWRFQLSAGRQDRDVLDRAVFPAFHGHFDADEHLAAFGGDTEPIDPDNTLVHYQFPREVSAVDALAPAASLTHQMTEQDQDYLVEQLETIVAAARPADAPA